ncbi:putative gamma-glutamylcyclotransferase CG2811 [Clavelina lepadiformis]|uniref:putative gamma-glutamylcyclotransferase CG2811 n=1 Tax=Clavelina lepadiformis TaxID=159417 RepID=UPI004041AA69
MVKVFVYGTLKTGHPNHYRLKDANNGFTKFISKAITKTKFPLVVATKYNIPFMLHDPGNGNYIKGELYDVDHNMLEVLDKLETHPVLYERTPIFVDLAQSTNINNEISATSLECETYILHNYKELLLNLPFIDCYDGVHTYVPAKMREENARDLVKKEV